MRPAQPCAAEALSALLRPVCDLIAPWLRVPIPHEQDSLRDHVHMTATTVHCNTCLY